MCDANLFTFMITRHDRSFAYCPAVPKKGCCAVTRRNVRNIITRPSEFRQVSLCACVRERERGESEKKRGRE